MIYSAANVLHFIYETQTKYNPRFNPTLLHGGVQGLLHNNGSATIQACGTFHLQDESSGEFEQLFSLVRDPLTNNSWKIKYTELRMKKFGT
jgi:hypothetical protein